MNSHSTKFHKSKSKNSTVIPGGGGPVPLPVGPHPLPGPPTAACSSLTWPPATYSSYSTVSVPPPPTALARIRPGRPDTDLVCSDHRGDHNFYHFYFAVSICPCTVRFLKFIDPNSV